MSGGGGGGSSSGGGFVPRKPVPAGRRLRDEDKCAISVQLPLSAVNPANVKKLKLNDTLNVALQNTKGVDTVIAIIPSDKSVVGAIAYRDVQLLIDCMNEGFEYTARVISYTPTSVKVQITRK